MSHWIFVRIVHVSSFFCALSPVQKRSRNFGTSTIMSSKHDVAVRHRVEARGR